MTSTKHISSGSNPLGMERVGRLMLRFAIPSIIAMMVSALYNIVDQLFIGQAVGTLGNAATNVAFPLSMMCTALALAFGIGGASNFNLSTGRGDYRTSGYFIGNSISMLAISGLVLTIIAEVFLNKLLILFGSPSDVLPYAVSYVRITALGFPFLLTTVGGGHLIRADGSPRISMIINLSGAVINTFLDWIFVMVLNMGMEGAALATITGQIFSCVLAAVYYTRYKTVRLTLKMLIPNFSYIKKTLTLGAASFFNQLAMMVVQIALNNSLKYYGKLSEYGESVPIACSGIVSKVGMLFFAIVIGIAQGSQPIEGFNYGARNYGRVKKTYRLAVTASGIISAIAFLIFQIFPKQIIAAFGDADENTVTFGAMFFKIYMFCTLINFLQPISATFFTSIGKAYKGMFLSLTRQFIFLLPLIIILPMFFGLGGIVYTAPIADSLAFIITVIMVVYEFRDMAGLEKQEKDHTAD